MHALAAGKDLHSIPDVSLLLFPPAAHILMPWRWKLRNTTEREREREREIEKCGVRVRRNDRQVQYEWQQRCIIALLIDDPWERNHSSSKRREKFEGRKSAKSVTRVLPGSNISSNSNDSLLDSSSWSFPLISLCFASVRLPSTWLYFFLACRYIFLLFCWHMRYLTVIHRHAVVCCVFPCMHVSFCSCMFLQRFHVSPLCLFVFVFCIVVYQMIFEVSDCDVHTNVSVYLPFL